MRKVHVIQQEQDAFQRVVLSRLAFLLSRPHHKVGLDVLWPGEWPKDDFVPLDHDLLLFDGVLSQDAEDVRHLAQLALTVGQECPISSAQVQGL